MEMGTAIVGLIAILICIAPFVIMYYIRIKKENRILQSLHEIAQQNNCKISQHEFCSDYVMGIDEKRNFVFFFKQKKDEVTAQFVDLSDIQTCQVLKKTRTVHTDKGNLSIIEHVELSFIPTNKNQGEVKFEIYDQTINLQLTSELEFVDKWSKQINKLL